MTTIAGQLGNFNNLLYNTRNNSIANYLEHKAGRVPLDLSYKTPARTNEVLNCKAAQINGKYGDLKYKPKILHSRPYYGYDAKFDPTILNAVRYKYVDVSGRLIAPIDLPRRHTQVAYKPLIPYGVVH